jgi:hypothetical protein
VQARTPCAIALTLAAGVALAADPPPPGGIPDLVGPRTLGLSAAIGTAAGNDGIYVNPGAIAARRRYSVEAGVLVDRRGSRTMDRFLGGSVVDSMSAPVTAGVSFLRAQEGIYTGNIVHGVLAGPVREKFFLGVAAKWLSVDGPRSSSAATADAGILWQVSDLFSVGATGYNLIPIANDAIAPMGAGAGVALGNDRSLQVTGDWRADFDRAGKTTNRYSAGAEVLLGRLVPIRAGWTQDETLDTQWLSFGAGIVTQGGVAFDVGYRQSVDDPSARTIAASLKLFLFQ